jgi:hypothetical protein
MIMLRGWSISFKWGEQKLLNQHLNNHQNQSREATCALDQIWLAKSAFAISIIEVLGIGWDDQKPDQHEDNHQ